MDNVQRIREAGILSATWDVYVTPSLTVQGPKQQRMQNDDRSQGWGRPQRQEEFPDPTGQVHTQTHRDRTAQAQARQRSQLRVDGHIVPPWQRCCTQLAAARIQ